MNQQDKVFGKTEDEVWQQIDNHFKVDPEPLHYSVVVEQDQRIIHLNIDVDLGGGFESGYETTILTSPLHSATTFRFAIHEKHFMDEIGKFFGMQDAEIGYTEFDDKLIIKTNDQLRVREIFSEDFVRQIFLSLTDFSFGIIHKATGKGFDEPFVELQIETGITNTTRLREIYRAFYTAATKADAVT